MSRAPVDLATKLDLALKVANMSKGRLASEARVDKSLVGRWVRGLVVPSEHNLASMTEALSRRFPGFNLASWHLPREAFARSIGGAFPLAPTSTVGASAPGSGEFLARSCAASRSTMGDERRCCQGVYLGFRHGMRMGGRLICEIYVIWPEGDVLMFKQLGVSFAHVGQACVLRGQIYLMGEDVGVIQTLVFVIMIGVLGGRVMRMDGVLLTAAGRHRPDAPSSTAMVMQRIADLPAGDGYPDQAVLDRLLQRVKNVVATDNFKDLIAPEILAAISSSGEGPGGGAGHILSIGMEDTLGRSETECGEAIAQYSKTLREIFLAEDATLLPMAPALAAPAVIF